MQVRCFLHFRVQAALVVLVGATGCGTTSERLPHTQSYKAPVTFDTPFTVTYEQVDTLYNVGRAGTRKNVYSMTASVDGDKTFQQLDVQGKPKRRITQVFDGKDQINSTGTYQLQEPRDAVMMWQHQDLGNPVLEGCLVSSQNARQLIVKKQATLVQESTSAVLGKTQLYKYAFDREDGKGSVAGTFVIATDHNGIVVQSDSRERSGGQASKHLYHCLNVVDKASISVPALCEVKSYLSPDLQKPWYEGTFTLTDFHMGPAFPECFSTRLPPRSRLVDGVNSNSWRVLPNGELEFIPELSPHPTNLWGIVFFVSAATLLCWGVFRLVAIIRRKQQAAA